MHKTTMAFPTRQKVAQTTRTAGLAEAFCRLQPNSTLRESAAALLADTAPFQEDKVPSTFQLSRMEDPCDVKVSKD